jgi:hypothetical protein
MKKLIFSFFFALCLSGVVGCGSGKGDIDWKKEVQTYEEKGWKFKEMFGTPDMAGLVGNADSRTARTIKGFWVEKGVRHEQEYKQETQLYCILCFAKKGGDSFLVVLSKDK